MVNIFFHILTETSKNREYDNLTADELVATLFNTAHDCEDD